MEKKPITRQPGLPEDPTVIKTQPTVRTYVLNPAPNTTWMPRPLSIQGVPTGLEQLIAVDRIQIYQIKAFTEIFTDFEIDKKYVMVNSKMEQIYYGFTEPATLCEEVIRGQNRDFVIHILDRSQMEVLTIKRKFENCFPYFNPCAQKCTIESPILGLLCTIRPKLGCFFLHFDVPVEGKNDNFLVQATGLFKILLCQERKFTIQYKKTGEEIGKITRKLDTQLFENTTIKPGQFFVNFPMDLDVQQKGALLGATFFAAYCHYQQDLSVGRCGIPQPETAPIRYQ